MYLQGLLLKSEEKNLTLQEAMNYVIDEEVVYISALKNGFNLTDKEVREPLGEESLDKEAFDYYKKYYIIAKYKEHIINSSGKDFSITDEEARDLFEFLKETQPQVYPPFEELKEELKYRLRKQEEINYLDEYIYQLRQETNIEFVNDFILDDLSIYTPGMSAEEFYDIYFNDTEQNTTTLENNSLNKELISLN